MKKNILLFILSFSSLFSFAQDDLIVVDNPNGDDYIQGRINLKVKPEYRLYFQELKNEIPGFELLEITGLRRKFPNRKPLEKQFHANGQKLPDLSLIYELDYTAELDVFKTSEQLMASGYFDYAEPHYVSYPLYTPNDNQLSINPYHFNTLQLYAAWDITKGDTNVVIGYTDTSFDLYHIDMRDNVKLNYGDPLNGIDDDNDGYEDNYRGWDLADDDSTLFIYNEIHGTTVAAVGSATGDNDTGYLGSGFKCKYIPVKVANSAQTITKGYEGIVYCVDHGAKIVNCSWGNTTFNQLAQDITDDAILINDVLIVASAGNIPYDTAYYPASYRFVLSVSGVDALDRFDPPSNNPFSWNDSVDVTAPGFSVYTTATYGGNPLYAPPQGGTSIAAPLVAGVAGLVWSQFPCLTALEVMEQIKATTDNVNSITENAPFLGKIGTGRVNAYQAVLGNLCSVGVDEVSGTRLDMVVYPNPANENLTILFKSKKDTKAQLDIFNGLGEKVIASENLNFITGNNTQSFNVKDLAQGVYFINITVENQRKSVLFIKSE